MLAEAIVARLAGLDGLGDRVRGALDFAELQRRNALPGYSPAVFVSHNGIVGRAAEFSENLFVQAAEELVSVVLVLRTAGDVSGAKSQSELGPLVWTLILGLCGWAPDPADEEASGADPVGVLELRRGRIVRLEAGTVFYQLDFAIGQQVRVLG